MKMVAAPHSSEVSYRGGGKFIQKNSHDKEHGATEEKKQK